MKYMLKIALVVCSLQVFCFAQNPLDVPPTPLQAILSIPATPPQASQRSGFRIDMSALRAEVAESRTGGIWRRFTVIISGFDPQATDEAREATVHTL